MSKQPSKESISALLTLADNAYFSGQEEYETIAYEAIVWLKSLVEEEE